MNQLREEDLVERLLLMGRGGQKDHKMTHPESLGQSVMNPGLETSDP